MRFSDTLIAIASLSAAVKAQECLAIDDGCANAPDSCCEGAWCNRWSMKCESTETKQNENGADVGEPCDANADCDSGWCNIHSIPHVCGATDNGKAAEGEACDVNDDCESAWCNMWAIPHVCGGDENGAAVGEQCDVNTDCESGWCNIHSIPHVCGATDEKEIAGPWKDCMHNNDCKSGYCNRYIHRCAYCAKEFETCSTQPQNCCSGYYCNVVDNTCIESVMAAEEQNADTCLAIGDGCANDPDSCCEGAWCNRWSMACESTEKDGSYVKQLLEVFQ